MGWKLTAVAAVVLGFGVLPAAAQMRGGAHVSVARSAPVVMRSAGSVRQVASHPVLTRARRSTVSTANNFVNTPFTGTGFFAGGTVQDLFGFPTPGLGFDYPHLAAINGNLAVRALIDPITQQEIALALSIRGAGTGFFPGFFPAFGAAPIVVASPAAVEAPPFEAAAQQQQPIIVVTPPAAAPTQAPIAEQTPLPDPGEFILVQRDGRLLFAVAFTSTDGRVVYVTKEGLRRSIALDQLDVNSTLRMNEERGTTLHLPAA